MSEFVNLSIDSASTRGPERAELSTHLATRNSALEAGLERAFGEASGSSKEEDKTKSANDSPKEVYFPYFAPKKPAASTSFYLHADKDPGSDNDEDSHAKIANMLEEASAVALAIVSLSKEESEEEEEEGPPKKKRRFKRRNSVVIPRSGPGGLSPTPDDSLKLTYRQSSQNEGGNPLGLPKREAALVFQSISMPWRAKGDGTDEAPHAA